MVGNAMRFRSGKEDMQFLVSVPDSSCHDNTIKPEPTLALWNCSTDRLVVAHHTAKYNSLQIFTVWNYFPTRTSCCLKQTEQCSHFYRAAPQRSAICG